MALLFVGGVMNLYWVIGLAVYTWLEKMSFFCQRVSMLAGAVLVVWGAMLLMGPG